eukprot:2959310-Rhodomonas_salina.2
MAEGPTERRGSQAQEKQRADEKRVVRESEEDGSKENGKGRALEPQGRHHAHQGRVIVRVTGEEAGRVTYRAGTVSLFIQYDLLPAEPPLRKAVQTRLRT